MRQIFLIRLALILGVSMFAGISVYLRSRGSLTAEELAPPEMLGKLRYAVWALSAGAVAWALFFRGRVESAKSEQQVNSSLIVGWAPGEGAALLAVVQHFQGGSVATMAIGLLAFVVVLLLLPIPVPRR